MRKRGEHCLAPLQPHLSPSTWEHDSDVPWPEAAGPGVRLGTKRGARDVGWCEGKGSRLRRRGWGEGQEGRWGGEGVEKEQDGEGGDLVFAAGGTRDPEARLEGSGGGCRAGSGSRHSSQPRASCACRGPLLMPPKPPERGGSWGGQEPSSGWSCAWARSRTAAAEPRPTAETSPPWRAAGTPGPGPEPSLPTGPSTSFRAAARPASRAGRMRDRGPAGDRQDRPTAAALDLRLGSFLENGARWLRRGEGQGWEAGGHSGSRRRGAGGSPFQRSRPSGNLRAAKHAGSIPCSPSLKEPQRGHMAESCLPAHQV